LARLLADLDSKRFAARRAAAEELVRLREAALPALKQFLEGKPSLEARKRAEAILPRIVRDPASGDVLRDWRAVRVLERIGGKGARAQLEALAGGAHGVLLTREAKAALGRLSRQ
jgi:hypothetical protein